MSVIQVIAKPINPVVVMKSKNNSKVVVFANNPQPNIIIRKQGTQGTQGAQGAQGIQGISGTSGYNHTQGSSSTVWTIPHNLGYIPSVEIIDSAGSEVEGDVHHNDLNNTTIILTDSMSGKARLI